MRCTQILMRDQLREVWHSFLKMKHKLEKERQRSEVLFNRDGDHSGGHSDDRDDAHDDVGSSGGTCGMGSSGACSGDRGARDGVHGNTLDSDDDSNVSNILQEYLRSVLQR